MKWVFVFGSYHLCLGGGGSLVHLYRLHSELRYRLSIYLPQHGCSDFGRWHGMGMGFHFNHKLCIPTLKIRSSLPHIVLAELEIIKARHPPDDQGAISSGECPYFGGNRSSLLKKGRSFFTRTTTSQAETEECTMGKLQGINLTPELCSIIDTVLLLPQPPSSTREVQEKTAAENANSSGAGGSSSPRSMSASAPSALLEQVQKASREVTRPAFTVRGAKSMVEDATKSGGSKNDKSMTLTLDGVQALAFLIANSKQSESNNKSQLIQQLESALKKSSLSFAQPAAKTTNPEYEKRLERLRLHAEERSYGNLTTNIKGANIKDDNVTAKSMMYATSVGLNMVVAPISFGVFMYFFAGSICSRFFDSEETIDKRGNDIDVRRVIAGVVSGVFMLFVEMILFVIRSHELDASVRKKSKRKENRANPFGYTQKSMARVYDRDD